MIVYSLEGSSERREVERKFEEESRCFDSFASALRDYDFASSAIHQILIERTIPAPDQSEVENTLFPSPSDRILSQTRLFSRDLSRHLDPFDEARRRHCNHTEQTASTVQTASEQTSNTQRFVSPKLLPSFDLDRSSPTSISATSLPRSLHAPSTTSSPSSSS